MAPEPSEATRVVQPDGAPNVLPVAPAVFPVQLFTHSKPAPTGTENDVPLCDPPVDDVAGRMWLVIPGDGLVGAAEGATPLTVASRVANPALNEVMLAY